MSVPLCENCVGGHVLLGTPAGTIVAIGGVNAYFSPAPNPSGPDPADKRKAVVLLTDAFGLSIPNQKIIADDFAKRLNIDVWVPDTFNGKPIMSPEYLEKLGHDKPGTPKTFGSTLRFILLVMTLIRPMVITHRSSVYDPRVQNFINGIKAEKKYKSVGSVGYCFGGSGVLRLASTGLISSGVLVHPGPATKVAVDEIKCPTLWLLPEEDDRFNTEVKVNVEAWLEARKDKFPYKWKIYQGTTHGFAARPLLSDPEIKEAYNDHLERTTEWFKNTL